jgi:hypothetical protein
MSTGSKLSNIVCAALFGVAFLCPGHPVLADTAHSQKKAKKVEQPALPSGPTGPVQQVPLDSIGAVPPQVTFQNNQLTIVAPNSTLADILRAVRKQTGAEIEIPPAPERVVTHLGPGPARSVVAELLNGSRFNYILLGSPADDSVLARVVLVAKSGPDLTAMPGGAQAGVAQNPQNPPQDSSQDMNDSQSADDSANDDNASETPAAEAEQAPNPPEQNAIKTPQQMLQEMQQRQMQLQQQQQQAQPVPGSGMPPHPPGEN